MKNRAHVLFSTRVLDEDVPDSYFDGQESFEHVVELLQDGCVSLLEHLKKNNI